MNSHFDNFEDDFDSQLKSNELVLYTNEEEQFDQIPEVQEIKNKTDIKILKIIHSNLTNLKGLQEFRSLVNIDLSSNRISSMNFYFKGLRSVKMLNLSCNMLTNVNGIEALISLEEVNLSHNKISNLEGFSLLAGGMSTIPLHSIDLRDNLVSSLNQIVSLELLPNLTSLIFQEKNGTNPICNNENYYDFLRESLVNLKMLDNRDINVEGNLNYTTNFDGYNTNTNQNYNPNPNHNNSSPFIYDIKYRNFSQNTNNFKSPYHMKNISGFKTLNPHNHTNVNLYKEEIKNLQNNIEELFRDQKELVYKYEKNENYWKSKVEDLTDNIKVIKEQNSNLTSQIDEKDFLIREQSNKLSLKEQELQVIRRTLEEKDNAISEISSRFSLLKKDYEFSLIDNEKLVKNHSDVTRELSELREENKKLKEDLSKEYNFYKDLSQKKADELNQKLRAISSLENKIYDFTKSLNDKQKEIESLVETNNYLQTNVVKYNKMKNETEFELGVKFEKEKEDIIKKYKTQIEEMENNFKRILSQKDEEFLKDMKMLEKSYEDLVAEKVTKIESAKRENEKLNIQLADCKELLKMSLQNEEKNEKVIKDLEKFINELNIEKENYGNKFNVEKESLMNKMKYMEVEIKEQNEQIIKLDGIIKNNKLTITEKDSEINAYFEENQKLKREVSIERNKLAQIEKEILMKTDEINQMKIKINSDENLRKIDEVNDVLKTKNMIIDDQTNQIIELKHLLQEKDDEIANVNGKVDKVRQKYEKKINQMQNDFEEANMHLESQNKIMNDYEEVISDLKSEIDKLTEDKAGLINKMQDRDEIIKLIQAEINDIKNGSESSQKQIIEKNNEINNLKEIIEELNKNLLGKNKENKEILLHFESFRCEKAAEIEGLNKQLSEVQNDLLVVLGEYEKQKNVIKMNIQNLNSMFGV